MKIYFTISVLLFGMGNAQIYTPNGNVNGTTSNPQTNNVGIGTTIPGQKLTVDAPHGEPNKSGSLQKGILRLQTAQAIGWGEVLDFGMHIGVEGPPSYGWIQATNQDNLGINYNLALNPNGGNVGIGTTNPTHRLTSTVSSIDLAADRSYPFFASVAEKGVVIGYDRTNDIGLINGVDTGVAWKGISLATYGGNVGIGTANPQAKLDVNGGGIFKGGLSLLNSETKGASNLLISGNGGYIPAGIIFRDTSYTQSGQINDWAIWKGNEWLKGLGFMRYDAVDRCSSGICDLPLMLWDNGNISMGISQARFDINTKLYVNDNLSVNAKLEAKEVKVTTTPTADFVFAEDYQLPKLETVEKHIKEKKHLPEIASAKEMEKEGVDVGEFQIKLLQKIEELTLYIIQIKKDINKLEEENKTLKQKRKN